MKGKTLSIIGLVTLLLISAVAQATPTIQEVKINGDIVTTNEQLVVKRGETLDITVKVKALAPEKNVRIEAYIDGYEYESYEPISDSSDIFDMDTNDAEVTHLTIHIPLKAEKDYYDLKVRVGTRTGSSIENTYFLNLKGERHEIAIKDILMTSEIAAGRGLFTNVRIQNFGQKTEEDVTVKVRIPELNIEEFTTVQELEADDSTTTEDVVLFINECTKPGDYDVIAEVYFNEYDKVTRTETITVTESGPCQKESEGAGKTVVSVPGAQEVAAGGQAVFPIMITNTASTARTYVITVSKAVEAFGTARIDPTNVVIVQPNKQETVFVYVKANEDATQGQKDFTVTITSGADKQDIALSANVVEGKSSGADLKKVLEISLVVLIVILVIAGLVIGFNKLKPKDDEEVSSGELGQTYY